MIYFMEEDRESKVVQKELKETLHELDMDTVTKQIDELTRVHLAADDPLVAPIDVNAQFPTGIHVAAAKGAQLRARAAKLQDLENARRMQQRTEEDQKNIVKSAKFVTFRSVDRHIYRKVKQMLMNTSIIVSKKFSLSSYTKMLHSKDIEVEGNKDFEEAQNEIERMIALEKSLQESDGDAVLDKTEAPPSDKQLAKDEKSAEIEASAETEVEEKMIKRARMLNKLKEMTLDIIEEFEAIDVHRYVDALKRFVMMRMLPSADEVFAAIQDNCKATAQAGTIFAEVFFTAAQKIDERARDGQSETFKQLKIYWHGLGVDELSHKREPKSLEELQISTLFRFIKTELDWRDSSEMRAYYKKTREALVKINKHKNQIEIVEEQPKNTDIEAIPKELTTLDDWVLKEFKTEIRPQFSGELAQYILESEKGSGGLAKMARSALALPGILGASKVALGDEPF